METANLTIELDYQLGSKSIYNLREIFCRIISFYFYKKVVYCKTSRTYDEIAEKWLYSFSSYNQDGIIRLTESAKSKLLHLSIEKYVGMKLVTHSMLAFMSDLSEKIKFYYKPWGVITEASDITYEQIQDINNNILYYEDLYYYFNKSPSVLEMADTLNIFHTEFDNYVVVKRSCPISKMMKVLGDILLNK